MGEDDVYAFARTLDWQHALVIFNTSRAEKTVSMDARVADGLCFADVWNGDDQNRVAHVVENGRVENVRVPARSVAVLVALV